MYHIDINLGISRDFIKLHGAVVETDVGVAQVTLLYQERGLYRLSGIGREGGRFKKSYRYL